MASTCNKDTDSPSTFINFTRNLMKSFILLIVVVCVMALKTRLITEDTTLFYTALFVIGGTVLMTILGTLDNYVYSNMTLGIGMALGLYVLDWRQPLKQ